MGIKAQIYEQIVVNKVILKVVFSLGQLDFLQCRQSQTEVLQQLSEALWKKQDVETVLVNQRKDGSIYYNQLEIKSVFGGLVGFTTVTVSE